jgi:hypothetical protein
MNDSVWWSVGRYFYLLVVLACSGGSFIFSFVLVMAASIALNAALSIVLSFLSFTHFILRHSPSIAYTHFFRRANISSSQPLRLPSYHPLWRPSRTPRLRCHWQHMAQLQDHIHVMASSSFHPSKAALYGISLPRGSDVGLRPAHHTKSPPATTRSSGPRRCGQANHPSHGGVTPSTRMVKPSRVFLAGSAPLFLRIIALVPLLTFKVCDCSAYSE